MYSEKTKAIIAGEEKEETTDDPFDLNKDGNLGPFEKAIKAAYEFCNGMMKANNIFYGQQTRSYEKAIETSQKYSLWTVLGMSVFFLGSAIFFLVQ